MPEAGAKLYGASLRGRIAAASSYTVFADGGEPPLRYRGSWLKCTGTRDPRTGEAWPRDVVEACTRGTWPTHAFGTANAPVLVLWHRPGIAAPGSQIDPETPTLGGVGHAHVERFVPDVLSADKSWDLLHRWLGRGLQAFGLAHPWSAVMVACLNPQPGPTGKVDRRANRDALQRGGRLDQICATTKPLLVLACGGPVRDAIRTEGWQPPQGTDLVEVDHPSAWEGYGTGRREGSEVIVPLFETWARTGSLIRPTAAMPATGARRYVDPTWRRVSDSTTSAAKPTEIA